MFSRKNVRNRDLVLKSAMREIEKLLKELEKEGKDISLMRLKKYQKTHHIDCVCPKCTRANQKNDHRLRGLREYGFKVFVAENDQEEIGSTRLLLSDD